MQIKIKTDYIDFEYSTPNTSIYAPDVLELNKILDKVFSAAPMKEVNPKKEVPVMTAEEFFDPKNYKDKK